MRNHGTDPAAQARRIREAVLRRHGFHAESEVPGIDAPSAIEDAANLARVSSHWGLTSRLPLVGGVLVLMQRTMRIGLRWYVNPIVDQQNAFNDAVVRALHELQADNDKLRADLQDLRQERSQ